MRKPYSPIVRRHSQRIVILAVPQAADHRNQGRNHARLGPTGYNARGMDPSTSQPRGELALVQAVRAILAPCGNPALPFGDDMAPLTPADARYLWSVDMLMDGVDFDGQRHDWHTIGRKAMAVNLSDCAAMAVRPCAALCALSLDNRLMPSQALDLVRGAQACGQAHGCPLVGGDTNSWDAPTVISITVVAERFEDHPPVRRDGARPGDLICVSGPLGGSILGRHLTFEPRLDLAHRLLAACRPHAMIDISDGLALDLYRVVDASGCGAELHTDLLEAVIHPDARQLSQQDRQGPRDHALYDGEDFELLIVLPPDTPDSTLTQLCLTRIGSIVADQGLWLREGRERKTLPIRGWEHFR